jgi:DNA-binding LacI/PurR family transcriptional regulator
MFVVEHPPHRSHYALAFPFREEEMRRSRFYEALRNEAAKMQFSARRFSIFYDISGHVDTEDYGRLERHVKAHTLAGVIFAASPFMLDGLAVVEESAIPRVAIASAPAELPEGVPTVCSAQVLPAALDCLRRQGCRRVAVMLSTIRRGEPPSDTHVIEQAIRVAGLETRTAWIQYVFPDHAFPIRQVARLLFDRSARQRPDGLLIADDNLVPAATGGLVAEGVQVPQHLKVVAHTNYPWPTASAVPVQRVGVDVTRLLEHCIEVLDLQRGGKPVPALTHATDTLVVGERLPGRISAAVDRVGEWGTAG